MNGRESLFPTVPRERAEYLLHHWTEPAFARTWQQDAAIGCARDVLALLDELDRLRAARSHADSAWLEAQERRLAAEAAASRYEQALLQIAEFPGKGAAGTGAAGWLLTLEAPEIARAALATGAAE